MSLDPATRRAAVESLTEDRETVRAILAELGVLARIAPDRSQDVIDEARNSARRLFEDLGAVRDELGRLAATP